MELNSFRGSDMRRSVMILLVFLGAMTAPVARADVQYEEVPVIESVPLIRVVEVSTPSEQCREEQVVVEHRDRGSDSHTPVVISTIIGGALGNAVGHGKSNRRVGTVVGAVLGHSIGRDIIRGQSDSYTREYQTVERCDTVYESHDEERIVGYRVTYNYNGQDYTVRSDKDPGATIRVRVSVEPVL